MDECLIKVLSDTACSPSVMLSNILPLGATSDCDVSTVVRGIETGVVPAPLHCIHVQLKSVSGVFPIAVRTCYAVDGVVFISVYPGLEVINASAAESEKDNFSNFSIY